MHGRDHAVGGADPIPGGQAAAARHLWLHLHSEGDTETTPMLAPAGTVPRLHRILVSQHRLHHRLVHLCDGEDGSGVPVPDAVAPWDRLTSKGTS
jgi:hypothetical protein